MRFFIALRCFSKEVEQEAGSQSKTDTIPSPKAISTLQEGRDIAKNIKAHEVATTKAYSPQWSSVDQHRPKGNAISSQYKCCSNLQGIKDLVEGNKQKEGDWKSFYLSRRII